MKASTAFLLNVIGVLAIAFICYALAWLVASFVWLKWATFFSTPGSRGLFAIFVLIWGWLCFKDPIFNEGD